MLKYEAEHIVETIIVASASQINLANLTRISSSVGANDNIDLVLILDASTQNILASNKNRFKGLNLSDINHPKGGFLNKLPVSLKEGWQFNDDGLIYYTQFDAISSDRKSIRPLLVVLSISSNQLSNLIAKSTQSLFFATVIGFITAILITILLLRKHVLNPIYRLINAIRDEEKADLIASLPQGNNDEITSLATEYNQLLLRLQSKQNELIFQTEQSKQAAKSKANFLAVMSHEIRTPLNGVIGITSILSKTNLTSHQQSLINTIQTSSNQLLSIISDVLDYSKIDAGKLELNIAACDLSSFINSLHQMFIPIASEAAIEFHVEEPENIKDVWLNIDEVRVRQILANLLSNAFKFTEFGYVKLSVNLKPRSSQTILNFSVEDTGIGMTQDQLDRLFTKFMQADASTARKYGGTGLGLAICKQLCELMKGTISVASHLDRGTKFNIEIPCTYGQPKNSSNINQGATQIRELNILIVDDVPLNQMIAKAMLKNHIITLANNGLEAIQQVNDTQFDIILMDCLMPEMDGFDTARVLRKSNIKTPIIALTASVIEETKEQCFEAGMNDFLSKPIVEADLLSKITKWAQCSTKQSSL